MGMLDFNDTVRQYSENVVETLRTTTDGLTALIVGALDKFGGTMLGTIGGIGETTKSIASIIPGLGGLTGSDISPAALIEPVVESVSAAPEKLGNWTHMSPEPVTSVEQSASYGSSIYNQLPQEFQQAVTQIASNFNTAISITAADVSALSASPELSAPGVVRGVIQATV